MDVDIDLSERADLAGEIYRQLRQAVLDGRLPPGERVPPSRDLARSLDVARATVVTAYERLRTEGFLVARTGAGTFVSDAVTPSAATWLHRPTPTDTALRPRGLWNDVVVPEPSDDPPAVDFRPGIPDATMFPYDVWRRLLGRELGGRDAEGGYGEGGYGDPSGHLGLRRAIAARVGASRGLDAAIEDITITNGTQQAVDLITRVLVDPGDQVAVEDPGYPPARRLFATLGARVVGVPVDGEGLVVDAIPARTRLVYVSPSHQFPLGTAMSLRRRLALLDWAQVHDAAIIEDDYDGEFGSDAHAVEPLQPLDPYGRVLYVGSFSKTMLATLRLGFVVAPESLHDAIRAAKFVTDWHTSLPVQATMARFIDDGWFTRHVRRMRGTYQERHEVVARVVADEFAGVLEVVDGSGGLHLSTMARGRSGAEIAAAVRRAAAAGVAVQPLSDFAIDGRAPAGLVVGYGAVRTDRIADGLRVLRECLG